ncbi:MAG TPA: VWA domain-containing protein [Nannocystaceae bacterium]|nr:VWA domain-containing protein [Nannocystaceae bacterium]
MTRHSICIALLALVALGGCRKKGDYYSPAAGGYAGEAMAYDPGGVVIASEAPEAPEQPSAEEYDAIVENDFIAVADDPLSTFAIDVDTASYSNVRRFLKDGALPPASAVRIEELVNYFDYSYEAPSGPHPFAVASEVAPAPWAPSHLLVRIGLEGKHIAQGKAPAKNLVFLLDVSGSMNAPDKLPLLQHAMRLLASQLRDTDRIAIVVYAGAAGVVLEPTSDRRAIEDAIGRLEAGGSTNGGQGIELAYALAAKNFQKDAVNRVVLATDGDFNVGVSSNGELMKLIEKQREGGVFLTVLGFGTGNLGDSTMETLADHGNGNYAYIDGPEEAEKVLLREVDSTLVTIAKDVKLQVEFNPAEVASYRLIGYENRKLAHQDFNDDKKDAGEIGAGHEVTALYEVVPAGIGSKDGKVDDLKYQNDRTTKVASIGGELLNVKLRYKQPDGDESTMFEVPVRAADANASTDFRFAAAVAEFGMLLRDSKHKGNASWAQTIELARESVGNDPHGERRELVGLVQAAAKLSGGDPIKRAR